MQIRRHRSLLYRHYQHHRSKGEGDDVEWTKEVEKEVEEALDLSADEDDERTSVS